MYFRKWNNQLLPIEFIVFFILLRIVTNYINKMLNAGYNRKLAKKAEST